MLGSPLPSALGSTVFWVKWVILCPSAWRGPLVAPSLPQRPGDTIAVQPSAQLPFGAGRRHPEPAGRAWGRGPSRASASVCPPRGDRPGAVAPHLAPSPRNWGEPVPLCAAVPSPRAARGPYGFYYLSHIFVGDCKRQGIIFFFFCPKFLVTVPGPPQLPHFGLFPFVLPNAKHVRGPPWSSPGIPRWR